MIDSVQLKKLRDDTPGCQNVIHLNNAGSALMPNPVLNAMKDYLDLESQIGGYEAAELKRKEIAGFYSEMAKMIGCQPNNIAHTANATDSYARAISSIPFEKGDIILTSNDDYISNQLVFLSFKKRFGTQLIRIANSEDGTVDLAEAERLIVEKKPKLVSISHVPTSSGLVQPIAAIGKLCQANDVLYLVDACQSAGQFQLNVKDIGCDFLSATFRKFLRGPRGAGFLYVSDKVLSLELTPLFVDMRGANWVSADEYELFEGARRFEDWEFSYALVMGSKAAVSYALEVGMENIEARTKLLTRKLREELANLTHVRVLDRGIDPCAIITLTVDGRDARRLKRKLQQESINTSLSSRSNAVIDFTEKGIDWAIRVSPHYYNSEEEIELFVKFLSGLTS